MNAYNYLKAALRLIISAKFKYIYAGIRRRFIFYFRRKYLNAQISKRKGQCSRLGHCCEKTFSWCQYFKHGLCSIYDRQPLFCRIFPIDKKDIELSDMQGSCNYYFD
jgi:Fe-S-cluster containining protein